MAPSQTVCNESAALCVALVCFLQLSLRLYTRRPNQHYVPFYEPCVKLLLRVEKVLYGTENTSCSNRSPDALHTSLRLYCHL
jgi:hypothetical protein